MGWETKKTMRKNLYKELPAIDGARDVYLPSYTNGIGWSDTKMVTASNQLRTINNESRYKSSVNKKNDNAFQISVATLSHASSVYGVTPLMEAVDISQDGGYVVATCEVAQSLQKGIIIKTDRPLMMYVYFAYTTLPNSTYDRLNFDLYCNDVLVKSFGDMRKLDYDYWVIDYVWGYFLNGWSTYVYPKNGEITIRAVQKKPFKYWNMQFNSAMGMVYLDSNRPDIFPVDQHIFAYEERR